MKGIDCSALGGFRVTGIISVFYVYTQQYKGEKASSNVPDRGLCLVLISPCGRWVITQAVGRSGFRLTGLATSDRTNLQKVPA